MLTFHVPLPYDLTDPLEQGGLLFGVGDDVYAVTGPQPDDDRGAHHLSLISPQHLRAAERAYAEGYDYLGYWHSHPAGTPFTPSEVDLTDFRQALETMQVESLVFPIVTGGVTHVYRLDRAGHLKEVPWTSKP